MFSGFTAAIGAHSISEEAVMFLLYGFPEENSWCLLSLVIIFVHVILSDNILRSYCLNDKNLTLKYKVDSNIGYDSLLLISTVHYFIMLLL